MKTILTALAGAALLLSGGAMAQGMHNGQMNNGQMNTGGGMDHMPNGQMDHPANNGDRDHVGVVHTNHNGTMHTDNRVVHRDSRQMRHSGWSRNSRHPHCRTIWRHHHRVRICR